MLKYGVQLKLAKAAPFLATANIRKVPVTMSFFDQEV
jgi:hypothetical protein